MSILLCLSVETIVAQMNFVIAVENQSLSKQSDVTRIRFDLNLDELELGNKDMLVITPVMLSKDGKVVELKPMAIKGRLKSKVLDSPFEWNGKTYPDIAQHLQVVRKNRTNQSLHYDITLPYSDWHRQAQLALKTDFLVSSDN